MGSNTDTEAASVGYIHPPRSIPAPITIAHNATQLSTTLTQIKYNTIQTNHKTIIEIGAQNKSLPSPIEIAVVPLY